MTYAIQQVSKYATGIALLAMLGFSMVLAPVAKAAPVDEDVFGVEPIKDETNLGTQDFRTTIASLINVALGLLGVVAVVIVLIGGFQWMTAGGDEEKVAGARKLIFAGIIGMAVILSAYAISIFVLNALGTATGVENFEEVAP